MKSLCSYPGCEKPVVARSLCREIRKPKRIGATALWLPAEEAKEAA